MAESDVRTVVESLNSLGRSVARPLGTHWSRGFASLTWHWSRLPRRLRWPAFRVLVLMCAVEIGLRTMDLRRFGALARVPLGNSGVSEGVQPADLTQLELRERRMLRAVGWLDGRWFTPMTCLRRALVTGIVLRRRHPVLRLGITGGGTTAHAWIEAEGMGYGMEDVGGVFTAPV